MFIIFFIVIIIAKIIRNNYTNIYKERIIQNIIEDASISLQYYLSQGMSESEYNYAKFESYDRYNSEDLLIGYVNGIRFKLADVHTENRHEDNDGNTIALSNNDETWKLGIT